MKILPANFPQQEAANARAAGMRYEQQWRKALEEAQWQTRQRTAIQLPREERAPVASNDVAVPEKPARLPGDPATEVWLAPRMQSAVDEPSVQPLARAVVNALRTTTLHGDDAAEAAAVAGRTTQPQGPEPVLAATPDEEPAPLTRFDWKQLPEWPSVVMSTTVSGNKVSIVMRDPTLLDDDALGLFYRLRSRLAATGLELADLTINGCSVLPPDSPLAQW